MRCQAILRIIQWNDIELDLVAFKLLEIDLDDSLDPLVVNYMESLAVNPLKSSRKVWNFFLSSIKQLSGDLHDLLLLVKCVPDDEFGPISVEIDVLVKVWSEDERILRQLYQIVGEVEESVNFFPGISVCVDLVSILVNSIR